MKRDLSSSDKSGLHFALTYQRPTLCTATVTIPKHIINTLYHETTATQQQAVETQGFQRGNIPLAYIEKNFKINITEHLKEFIFKYCVINFLYQQIREQKILVAGEPRLINIHLEPNEDAQYVFELTIFPSIPIHEWKYFPFKEPKRKNYKDLDRQVENFIKDERTHFDQATNTPLKIGDWISFEISLADKNNKPILDNFSQNFWYRLGDEEVESPLRALFIGREYDAEFYTTNKGLQECFSDQLNSFYNFHINIVATLPHRYFCFDQFKRHFRVKTNKDMHKKLIEVFSSRNDISQRLAMAQESLKLLLSKHQFKIPQHLVLRQQNNILRAIHKNPDYNVYRKQANFREQVQKLAEKQIKELVLIDQVAYHENIQISQEDLKSYFNLTKRPRMKEFIYFDMPDTKRDGQEVPIPTEELKRACLREKTINYTIYHLTKK